MILQRFEVPGLAHYSYLIASQGKAAVVDPKRDVDTYTEFAAARGLRITHVLETHIHADYASGARELAEATGAEMWLSGHDDNEDFEYKFAHHAFKDHEELRLGELRIVALYTPGHTPEHLSFLVYEKPDAPQPLLIFSGDFVFVGSLGRPDLLGEAAKQRLAGELYESLTSRIANLPDGLEVHPAHGAGSFCGAGMADRPQSTLGYERAMNRYFGVHSKAEFVAQILSNVPPFPEYYKRMKRVNSEGPTVLKGIPGAKTIAPAEFRTMAESGDYNVVDLRRPEAFGGAHVPGSINIGGDQNLSMWAAWVLSYDKPILLVGDDATDYDYARRSFIRVGLDNIAGSLHGGIRNWIVSGLPQAHVPQLSVHELAEKLKADSSTFVLDVRTASEFGGGHVRGAHWIMGGDLLPRIKEVPRDRTVHVICGSGYRSSIASSLLRAHGWERVANVVGGMTAWKQAGLPAEPGAMTQTGAQSG